MDFHGFMSICVFRRAEMITFWSILVEYLSSAHTQFSKKSRHKVVRKNCKIQNLLVDVLTSIKSGIAQFRTLLVETTNFVYFLVTFFKTEIFQTNGFSWFSIILAPPDTQPMQITM